MKIKLFTILYVYLFLGIVAYAQNPAFYFRQITLTQGLSESTIRDIVEDKQGYMWFCTEDGLNKYDGSKFQVYRSDMNHRNSISSNHPNKLMVDSKGNLWVLTEDGVNIYNSQKDNFDNPQTIKYRALADLQIASEAIAEDNFGNVWIAGNGNVLFKIKSLNEPAEQYKFSALNNIRAFFSLASDSAGNMWIGTRDGLVKFNDSSKKFSSYKHICGGGYLISDLLLDSHKNLWMGTNNGMRVYNLKKNTFREYKHTEEPTSILGKNVRNIIKYDDNNLIIGIDGSGIDFFNIPTGKSHHYTQENKSQLNCNNITCVYFDSKHNLWAGTFLNGINYSNSSSELFVFEENNLYSQTEIKKGIITNFVKDSLGNFWVGTDGGGLFLKKKGEEIYTNYKGEDDKNPLSSNVIIGMVYFNGDLWISTFDGGLTRLNIKTNKFTQYKNNPNDSNSIAGNRLGPVVIHEGKLWIAIHNFGMDRLDIENGEFTHFPADEIHKNSLLSSYVISLLSDKAGNLWLGTDKGLCKYLPESNSFKNIKFSTNLYNTSRDFIADMVDSDNGIIWIGSAGGGLISFNYNSGTYQVYTTHHGLSGDNIHIVICDHLSKIWIGTTSGISYFDPKTKVGIAYTAKDGASNAAFYFRSKILNSDGKIFFGASKGYQIINPKMTKLNKIIPPIVLTQLKVCNKIIDPGKSNKILNNHINFQKKITLDYFENEIGFEFAALNFNNPDKNKFSYMLEGFDKGWSQPEHQKFAHYTNLNPGVYIFKVKGSNNDNVWNNAGAHITVEILSPYWSKWWFYTVLILLSISIVFAVFLWRVKSVNRKNKLLEEIVKLRTYELNDSNEQLEAFVYKASHDIKGPLRSIIGLTKIGQADVKDVTALSYFEHILKSTEKLDKLLLELLELTKIKQIVVNKEIIDFEELVNESLGGFQHLDNFNKIKIYTDIDSNQQFLSDKNLMRSIIQNLTENPFKYLDKSKAKSYLKISIKIYNNEALLKFEDNGIGIEREFFDKLFDMFFKVSSASNGTGLGLYLVKTSVDKLGGNIWVESEVGKGSTFFVQFKKPKLKPGFLTKSTIANH